jgi:hypothetical protein
MADAAIIWGMTYAIEIVLIKSPGIESDLGLPTYRLPGVYLTKAQADEAAAAHLKAKGLRPGTATWRIVDDSGNAV